MMQTASPPDLSARLDCSQEHHQFAAYNHHHQESSRSKHIRGPSLLSQTMATTASVYNASRTTRQVLKRHRKEGPSLTLHLYANTFRFDRQNGAFLCESPLKNLLYFIRDQKVPADLVDIFDEARVPFFEGCLIIEVHDHRSPSVSQKSAFPTPPTPRKRLVNGNAPTSPDAEASTSVFNTDSSARVLGGNYGFLRRLGADSHQRNGDQSGASGSSSPSVYRIVLYPSAETLWTDLRMLNEIEGAGLWRDEDVLEIESRILALTSPPLCLTPDLQVSRIANVMLSATAPPCAYAPTPTTSLPYFAPSNRKRGINSIEVELDESNKKRREKIMRMMEKGSSSKAKETIVGSSTHAPTFARMAFVERWRASKAATDANASVKLTDGMHGDTGNASMTDESRVIAPKKPKKKKKAAEEDGQDVKDVATPPLIPATKKKSTKKKKDQEAREQAEREAAAAAAAKVKEEEGTKKSKKGKKKDQAAQQQQQQQQQAQAQIQALAQAQVEAAEADSAKRQGKKTTKLKKAKIQPSPASSANASDGQQQYNGAPQQQQQMYQQMLNYQPQTLNQTNAAAGLSSSSYPGLFAGNVNGGGLALPGQGGNYTNVQQQHQLQQAAAAVQRGLQQQPGVNGNFMLNSQMQQHLQTLAAMQNHNLSNSPQSQPMQVNGQFNSQDALPVGVGLGNLPPNWNTMG